jgi:ribose 5-phosphate isomerase B
MSDANDSIGVVYLASDHAGFSLKEYIRAQLIENGYTVTDVGPDTLDPHDDYPDTIRPVIEPLLGSENARAIIFGMSGQGEAMVVNRVKGVRAVVYTGGPEEIIRLAREHNDANVLSLGARFVEPAVAWERVRLFLTTHFSGEERHARRIHKLDA